MSFCRTSIVEFNTEADADAFMADYNSNFESMFPEAESVMTSKVSPTLYVNNTVCDHGRHGKNRIWSKTSFIGQKQRLYETCFYPCWRSDII